MTKQHRLQATNMTKDKRSNHLEESYLLYFQAPPDPRDVTVHRDDCNDSLEQPWPSKFVETRTTYGVACLSV